ncbi:MAG: ICEBs1 excisionase [Lachnospiraceae bacterium]
MVGSKSAFVDVNEVCETLNVGKAKAYQIMREFNEELEAQGYLVIQGHCPRKYFEEKIYGYADCYKLKENMPICNNDASSSVKS